MHTEYMCQKCYSLAVVSAVLICMCTVFFQKKKGKFPIICPCFHFPFKILAKNILVVMIFTINIQDAFHSFESLPCEILAPIWNLFILQNYQFGDFLPFGSSGVFLRPSHSSEHGRGVETPLTIIGLLSHMTISHYLLLECTCEFCFKRPIYR